MIASDDNGTIDPSAQQLLPLIPIPYVTSERSRLGSRTAGSERSATGAARWASRSTLDDSTRRDSRRLRHLPESMGLQRSDSIRAQSAVLLHQAGQYSGSMCAFPRYQTREHADEQRDRHGRRQASWTMNTTSSTARRGAAASSTSSCRRRWSKSHTWERGRSAPTTRPIHNVPEPGPGSIQARRPIPQLSRINAIRFDGKSIYHGLTFKAERRLPNNFAYNISYTLSTLERRCVEPRRHRIGIKRAAECAKYLRRDW